ncbi:MAG: alpha/beta fold hydrolase [Chloroflexota bacterium]
MNDSAGNGLGLRRGFARGDGLRLHYVAAGNGPLVVLLHGFPEFWYSWRHQLPALARAGFRVVAPDQRGYNLSDKPRGLHAYRTERLADDVAALIADLGAERATVVGHDWGGAVAWCFALRHPRLLERLAILNAPPPTFASAARRLGLNLPRQLARSWYIYFFQLPWLPEALIRARDFASLRVQLRREPVRADAFSPADVERYVAALAQPGALTAALNYYRAALRYPPRLPNPPVVRAPVLVIWGEQDRYLRPELADPDPALVPHARVVRLPSASHWVQVDRPEEVNAALLAFLAGGSTGN